MQVAPHSIPTGDDKRETMPQNVLQSHPPPQLPRHILAVQGASSSLLVDDRRDNSGAHGTSSLPKCKPEPLVHHNGRDELKDIGARQQKRKRHGTANASTREEGGAVQTCLDARQRRAAYVLTTRRQ